MGASTPGDESKTKLVTGHAYSVLGAFTVNSNGR